MVVERRYHEGYHHAHRLLPLRDCAGQPTALVAAIGNAAMRGSLIKKGATIEALSNVDTVIFDKTGTLTAGKPKLLQIEALGDNSQDELLEKAARGEKFSEHPSGQSDGR